MEKAVVPEGAFTDCFGEDHPEMGYTHIHPHPGVVGMCAPIGPVVRLRIRRDEANGTHWGWWDAEDQRFTMVWPSRIQAAMCFTYGYEAEEKRGRGVFCRLSVEFLGPVT